MTALEMVDRVYGDKDGIVTRPECAAKGRLVLHLALASHRRRRDARLLLVRIPRSDRTPVSPPDRGDVSGMSG